MKKNILIISTSPRKGGNSDLLADEFLRGVKETENTVEKITLHDKTIGFCRGCLACQTTGKCVIKDDANAIVEQILHADVLVFATPVYFFEMSGQMKTLLDRTNPLFPTDYKFREIYLLAAAGEEEEHSVDGTVHGLQGWIDCFGKAKLAGVVRGVNSVVKGDIQKNITALTAAYEMGKNV
jgi:multimeric flavodoxin WrbA